MSSGDRMPGGFPSAGYENPYKASHPLDPRVDGGKAGQAPTTSNAGRNSALPAVAGAAGSGVDAPGASQAANSSSGRSHEATGPAPSAFTTTTDPPYRSAEYTESTDTKGLGSAPTEASTTSTQPQASEEKQGMISKVLGAVGLGGAATTAFGSGRKSEGADEPRDTSPIATQPGQASQETELPKHYRRESIPTTAYPAGPNSPPAVAPPVGGSQVPTTHADSRDSQVGGVGRSIYDQITIRPPEQESHTDRNVALGGAAAAAAGAEEYGLNDRSQDQPSAATGTTGATILPDRSRDAPIDQTTTRAPEYESHTGRNAALGGIATTAAGAGAYGLHKPSQDQPSAATGTTSMPDRSRDAPIDAVAAAPGRYDDQDAIAPPITTGPTKRYAEQPLREEDNTARHAALGAGAAAGAGGLAYAAHERGHGQVADPSARHASQLEREQWAARQRDDQEKAQMEHQKELEKQEKQHQKELEKERKQHEKEEKQYQKELEKEEKRHQREAEKEEKHHQKELEKEEKKRQKELEKEEKERQAAAAAAEKREQARLASEEEERKRREREEAAAATAGGAAIGAGAAGAAAMGGHRDERRSGAGAGHGTYDNIYERDYQGGEGRSSALRNEKDVDHAPHKEKEKKPSIFKRIFKRRKNKDTGEEEEYSTDDEEDKTRHAAAAGTAGGAASGSHVPTHHSDIKGRNVLGPASGRQSMETRDPTSGLPYDASRDPEAAPRLSHEPGADYTHGRGTGRVPGGTSAGTYTISNTRDRTTDTRATTTGLPYDSSRDPEASRGLSHEPGADDLPQTAFEPLGEVGEHRR